MKVAVLFRKDSTDQDNFKEYLTCDRILETTPYISTVPANSLVVGRYSVLPFYSDVEAEIRLKNSRLVNTLGQHNFIANFEYYDSVKNFTFPTYFGGFDRLPEGAYVVKGRTNSRKHRWNSHMFAPSKAKLMNTLNTLADDQWIFEQGLVVREYVPLYQVGEGINGLPITAEYRFFCYKEQLLSWGYYWSSHPEYKDQVDGLFIEKFLRGNLFKPYILNYLKDVMKVVSQYINFYVLDIALKEDKTPILVEINDGQMSGLSCCSAEYLYDNLRISLA